MCTDCMPNNVVNKAFFQASSNVFAGTKIKNEGWSQEKTKGWRKGGKNMPEPLRILTQMGEHLKEN